MAENKEQLTNPIEINKQGELINQRKDQVDIIKDVQAENGLIPREVKTWMEKFEISQNDDIKIVDDSTGQTVLTSTNPIDPKITLPIDRKSFTGGFSKPISDVGRWLSEFVFRFIKVKKGNVKFNKE